jgi:hypothetical protein
MNRYSAVQARIMRARLALAFVVAGLLVSFPAVTLFGQTLTGLSGTVTDSSGAVIADAAVTITNIDTKATTELKTTGSGTFTATGLQPGNYEATFSKAGFATLKQSGVKVDVGALATLSPVLGPVSTSAVVNVNAQALELNTSAPQDSTVVESQEIQQLPLQVGSGAVGNVPRQIDSFIFLAAGTTGSTFSKRINGGVDFQNEVLFNGIAQAPAESQGYQTGFNPPFESIGEFRVLRTSFSAQYGLGQGAINYQFRSGTNQLHGALYEYFRNEALDARPFGFGEKTLLNINKQNDYGFRVGGPVLIPHLYDGRDKLFFHFTYGWYGFRGAGNNTLETVPLPAFRTGNFADYPAPIYDPLTGLPFPGNQIPSSRISALSQAIIAHIPAPQFNTISNNIFPQIRSFPAFVHAFAVTTDYNLSEKQSLHLTYYRTSNAQPGVGSGGSFADNPLGSEESNTNLGTSVYINYNRTLSSNLVLQSGFGFFGSINGSNPVELKGDLNFPGLNAPNIPYITLGGPNSLTGFGTGGLSYNQNRKVGLTANSNVTWITGRNTFDIGGEFRNTKQNNAEATNGAGTFDFTNTQTSNPNNVGTDGYAFASFLLGLPNDASQSNAIETKLRNYSYSPYIQDAMKLSPRLTVNAGLRYDLLVPFHDVNNEIPFFDANGINPGAGNLPGVLSKFGSCAGCAGVDRAAIHWKDFSPRVGLAYELDHRTVVRSGYSLTYLNGGSYEYGTSKVSITYPGILAGQAFVYASGTTASSYGQWDSRSFPATTNVPFSPTLGLTQAVTDLDLNKSGRAPYLQEYTLMIQRELPGDVYVTAGYTGNRSLHLAAQLNILNQPNPSVLSHGSVLTDLVTSPAAVAAGVKQPYAGFATQWGTSATVAQALKPYPQYYSVGNNFDMSGKTEYNALQIEAQKRYSHGVSILVNYVWARLMANAQSGFSTFDAAPVNKYDQAAEYAVGSTDIANNFKASGVYELPIGPGKRFLNTKNLAGQILGGWQVGAVTNYYTGSPVEITQNGTPGTALAGFGVRPTLVGIPATLPGQSRAIYTGLPILNRSAFQQTPDFTLNDARAYYSPIRAPGYADEDVNLVKNFRIKERATVSFRAEYFNLLNRVEPGAPDGDIDDTTFGEIHSVANLPRVGQLSLRIDF